MEFLIARSRLATVGNRKTKSSLPNIPHIVSCISQLIALHANGASALRDARSLFLQHAKDTTPYLFCPPHVTVCEMQIQIFRPFFFNNFSKWEGKAVALSFSKRSREAGGHICKPHLQTGACIHSASLYDGPQRTH